ncbi:MAG: hypothetical protein ACXVAX_07680 [Pseudobdellovibrio sp.]
MIKKLLVTASLLFPAFAFAYPDFISYGYKNCITCHFDGAGGGPLNDYGRALFATEITAADANVSEEELTDESGFLGKTEIPWWIRPGAEFRAMALKTRVEDQKNSTTRVFPMQLQFNSAILLDKKAEKIFVGDLDYVPTPSRFASTSEKKPMSLVATQYYFRWLVDKGYILYAGLMDKPYGIRHADHTAFDRGVNYFGLDQNDQSHGIIFQYDQDKFEFFADYFIGNLNQDEPLRQKGFSMMGEYALQKDLVVGASVLKSKNEFLEMGRYGVHTRIGFAKGKSIMADIGFRTDKTLQINNPQTNGFYSYIQSMIAYARGYNILTTYQMYKDDMTSTGTLRNKLGLGLNFFPWKKTEFRAEVINDRLVVDQNSVPDTWTAQAQVHVSW